MERDWTEIILKGILVVIGLVLVGLLIGLVVMLFTCDPNTTTNFDVVQWVSNPSNPGSPLSMLR